MMDQLLASGWILNVWHALGGGQLRGGRGVAFWRPKADGFNVAISTDANCWYDHARGEGGGVLDLVQHVRCCDRKEALRWLAELCGVPLQDRRWTRDERAAYARRRKAAEAEARALVAWRSELLAQGRSRRNRYQTAYHRAIRHILSCGKAVECCGLAADVADAYEVRYQKLDQHLDAIRSATWPELRALYRSLRAGGRAA